MHAASKKPQHVPRVMACNVAVCWWWSQAFRLSPHQLHLLFTSLQRFSSVAGKLLGQVLPVTVQAASFRRRPNR